LSELPQITGLRLVRALKCAGFGEVRQVCSHLTMKHTTDATRRATVPMHGSATIKPGTLRAILAGAGLSVDDLRDLL